MKPGKFWKRWYLLIFAIYAFIGLFNSFLANHKPIMASGQQGWVFPAFRDFLSDIGIGNSNYIYNENTLYDWKINAPIPYTAGKPDTQNPGFKSPSTVHPMGTDPVGRDVLAGLVRGCYTSFRIGLFGTLICGSIGIFLGVVAGYFQNDGIRLNVLQWLIVLSGSYVLLFYTFYPLYATFIYFLVLTTGMVLLLKLALGQSGNLPWKKYDFPIDAIISKIIEIRKSIPSIIIVLACLPLFHSKSINNVILLIAVLGWTNFARHSRAETLSLKQREFVVASALMGGKFWHILKTHLLPNMKATMLTLAVSSFTANILLESTLSFLGMGLPATEVSWGSMMAEARKNFNAWWMFVFPGLAMMLLVFSLNYYSSRFLADKE